MNNNIKGFLLEAARRIEMGDEQELLKALAQLKADPDCARSYLSQYQLVGGIGLEHTTFAMSTRCSNQLSYPPKRRNYTGKVMFWE